MQEVKDMPNMAASFSYIFLSAFTASPFRYRPTALPIMTWVGAGYILRLAWTIFRDKKKGADRVFCAHCAAGHGLWLGTPK